MPAAALGTLVTDVAPGVVEDVEGFGRQHGEALAHLFDGVQSGFFVACIKDRGATEGFPSYSGLSLGASLGTS